MGLKTKTGKKEGYNSYKEKTEDNPEKLKTIKETFKIKQMNLELTQ